ncbi:MAG: phytoene desaturase family protein [Armatimonadota bacterium]
MANSVIIVGAGIAGLSAGCYARMNGYRAAIFEMHNIPGGLCTAWTRKGYTWDISMHLLAGSKTGPLHRMWRELGAVQHRRYHYHDVLTRVEDGGKSVAFCADLRQLEEQMLALSPGDARRIREFLRIFGGKSIVHLLPLDAPGTGSRLSALKMLFGMLPLLGAFRKYGKLTLREFADGFQDPFLRAAIPNILDHPGWPMPGYPLMGVAGFHTSALTEAGVPIGGSKGVIEDIANRFKRLGGELQCRCKVTEVIVENDRAVGIRLEDGTEHRANIVLWAADGRTLLFDLLGERYLTDELRTRYREWQVVRSMVHVMLGLKRDMRQEPCRLTFKVEKPITVGKTAFPWLYFMHHGFDPTSTPEGNTAAEVWYDTEYDYWGKLYQDRPAYEAEKRRIADETIAALDTRWPGLAADVEVVDVPTPATYHRYTGNWQGSVDGWYITPQNMGQPATLTLPGLQNLYMAGQWTAPFTGTVIAALTGRQAIQLLCKAEGKPFHTTEA